MLKLLEKSGVFVHLDPRRDGVAVPGWFRNQSELVLQIGLNMAVPIRDLEVDDEGVFCTLSFNRTPFYCRMPWSSIFGLFSDEDRRGVVWAADAPPESSYGRGAPAKPATKRPHLRAVGTDEPPPEDPDTTGGDEEREASAGAEICPECDAPFPLESDSCAVCGVDRASADDAVEAAIQPPPPKLESVRPRLVEATAPAEPSESTETDPRTSTVDEKEGSADAEEDESALDADGPEPPDPDGPPKKSRPPYLRLVK